MKNFVGKRILITGATNGIGRACAEMYGEAGANLVILGRNQKSLLYLSEEISKKHHVEVFSISEDVRNFEELKNKIDTLLEKIGPVDILINSAGLALGTDKFYLNSVEDIENVIDTNIKGILYMSKIIIPHMLKNNLAGHIVNLGSTAGNAAYAGGGVYCATKAAVKTLSDGMRIDLIDTPIRVTTVLPGMVETNFSVTRFKGDEEKAKHVYKGIEPLTAKDVADTILYATGLPKNIQITDLMVTPNAQADGRTVHKIL